MSKHFNNGNGDSACGLPGSLISWRLESDCPECQKIKTDLQNRIRKLRRLDADRTILEEVAASLNMDVSFDDLRDIHQRLREIKIERENLFPKNISEAYFMGEMQQEEGVCNVNSND